MYFSSYKPTSNTILENNSRGKKKIRVNDTQLYYVENITIRRYLFTYCTQLNQ